jgi:hypothetical protein
MLQQDTGEIYEERRVTQEQYIEAEMDLARALGWAELQVGGMDGTLKIPDTWVTGIEPGSTSKSRELVPHWARQSGPAFDLMVSQGCYPTEFDTGKAVRVVHSAATNQHGGFGILVLYAQHADKEAATRYAVVLAATRQLELKALLAKVANQG